MPQPRVEPPAASAEEHRRLRDLARSEWLDALKVSVLAIFREHLTDRAAALTYYSMLSLFPGMLVLVSLLGLLGDERTVDSLLRIVDDVGAESAVDMVERGAHEIVERQGAASIAFFVGLVGALYAASGYVNAFTRAGNAMYGVEETRPIWHVRPRVFLLTIVLVLAVAAFLMTLVFTGPVAQAVADELGFVSFADLFAAIRWPLLVAAVAALLSLIYRMTPNVPRPPLGWNLVGAGLATVLWLTASVGFSFYVATFANYGDTYGALAGVIVLLIWLWISNIAVVLGARLNVELRSRTGELVLEPGQPGRG